MTWNKLETRKLDQWHARTSQIHGSPTLQPTRLKSATILKPLPSISYSKLPSHQTKMLLCWFWTEPSPLSGCMMIYFSDTWTLLILALFPFFMGWSYGGVKSGWVVLQFLFWHWWMYSCHRQHILRYQRKHDKVEQLETILRWDQAPQCRRHIEALTLQYSVVNNTLLHEH